MICRVACELIPRTQRKDFISAIRRKKQNSYVCKLSGKRLSCLLRDGARVPFYQFGTLDERGSHVCACAYAAMVGTLSRML